MDGDGKFREAADAMKRPSAMMVMSAILALGAAGAKEVMVHSGPRVASPEASLYSPFPDSEKHGKDLTFIYEFFVEPEILGRIPENRFDADPLPASRAIELASKSAEVAERKTLFPVKKMELLFFGAGSKRIRYYLITLLTDGSAETHRVVLMDGTVVKPRLRRIAK